jgi:small basic protein (TIGR04137 family)
MSMHPSLKASEKGKKQRSVLKRMERIKWMIDKQQWKDGDKVYGLPKIKTLRIKFKKEKAAEKTTAEAAAGTAAETVSATAGKAAPATAGKVAPATAGKVAPGAAATAKKTEK